MNGTAQLPLALPHRPASGRADFLVAPANEAAVAWLDAWPSWPAPGLVVWGPEGSGKSHLAATWCLRSAAAVLSAASLDKTKLPEQLADRTAVLLEDVDAQAPDPRAWLHLYNMLAERGGHVLMTARTAPARWNLGLADLASRLKALPAVAIAQPDEALVETVLVKQLADRQLRAPRETVRYIVARLDRSLAAVASIVERLDAASLAAKRPLSIPLAREVMRAAGFEPEQLGI